jgi:RNA polymerase sigma-70 factor (ECF subfamily)
MVYNDALAEDIVQDVIAAACRVAGTPDGLPPEGPRQRGWFYRTARNRCIDELRKMRPEVRLSAMMASRAAFRPMADPLTTPARKSMKQEHAARAAEALDELEDDLRSVIIMRIYQSLSRDEIAEAVGLTVSGVKARLSKAMKQMQDKLKSLDQSGG